VHVYSQLPDLKSQVGSSLLQPSVQCCPWHGMLQPTARPEVSGRFLLAATFSAVLPLAWNADGKQGIHSRCCSSYHAPARCMCTPAGKLQFGWCMYMRHACSCTGGSTAAGGRGGG
jgi:hypothetical protein